MQSLYTVYKRKLRHKSLKPVPLMDIFYNAHAWLNPKTPHCLVMWKIVTFEKLIS